ncbi:MAG: hypothetical protein HC906_14735 [Bacteroidales bacterium]|nr:hypothetical protein [Bacteroidales bacterium]
MNKKKLIIPGILAVCIIVSLYFLKSYISPGFIDPEKISVWHVDYGPVSVTVPATGVINPENEVLLLSPASSIISKIYTAPGRKVVKGEIIMSLDPRAINKEIENLKDQLGIMENDLQKNQLNSRSIKVDLDYNTEVKKLKITSLKTEIADQEQLLKVGGISPAIFEQTKQELVLAERDLKMTQEKNSIRLKQLEADENGLLLQIDVRKKGIGIETYFTRFIYHKSTFEWNCS